MNSSIFKDYLKTLFPGMNFRLGRIDENIEKQITIYTRNGTSGLFFYGEGHTQKMPLTLTITYSKNYAETEQEVNKIFEALTNLNNIKFKNTVFSVFPFNSRLPVYLGYTESGFYQFALDIDVVYNK